MRILYVTTIGETMGFFAAVVKKLILDGNSVDIATNDTVSKVPSCFNEYGASVYHIDCSRSIFDIGNIRAIFQIKNLVKRGKYDIVHCHTPIAAVCARLACRGLRKNGVRVIYTAHGFHFYKGAPLKNWLLYYPAEKICSRWTDVLVTINKEDYELAKKKMRAKQVEYVPGVGIDTKGFADTIVDREKKREELCIPRDAFLLLSVGELNKNKNHQIVINALAQLSDNNIHYAIAGEGKQKDSLMELAKDLGIPEQVHLLGFRKDITELYKAADVDVFPSIREGLGLAAIEGMASGLPLICSDNRGTREYAVNGENSIVCVSNDINAFAEAISFMHNNDCKRSLMGKNAIEATKKFDIQIINQRMSTIYNSLWLIK